MRQYFSFVILIVVISRSNTDASSRNKDTQFTREERKTLLKFKTTIKDLITEDYQLLDNYLIHILRAEKLNIPESKAHFQRLLEWRKDNRLDEIIHDRKFQILERRTFPVSFDGVDKAGRPVMCFVMAQWNVRRFILAGKAHEFRQYILYIIEKAFQKVFSKALEGQDVSQFSLVVDLSGFNSRQHACLPCLQAMADLVSLLSSKYSGMVHSAIFINTPRSFRTVYELIKSNISNPRLNIRLFGYNKNEWRAHLKTLIDDDQLPRTFGGTKIAN